MSSIPSRVLDNEPVTTEVTVPEPNDRTCMSHLVFTARHGDEHQADIMSPVTGPCGKPATHSVFRTCCDGPVSFTCDDHANPFWLGKSAVCRNCHHRCVEGVCCHRVVTPL